MPSGVLGPRDSAPFSRDAWIRRWELILDPIMSAVNLKNVWVRGKLFTRRDLRGWNLRQPGPRRQGGGVCSGVSWCTFKERGRRLVGVVPGSVEGRVGEAGLETRCRRGRLPHEEVANLPSMVEARLGFRPDAAQSRVLESTTKRGILNCTRQWGKSTVCAAKAALRAWNEAGSLVLVASPTERQSAEFMRKVSDFVRRLGVRPRGDGDQALSLLFPNGSRIVGLPGTEGTVRGFSAVSLLIIDEAARVPDAMYKALRPMLAVKNGDLWLMSTPYGQRGFFWDIWEHGGEAWERTSVRATECPRIAAEFLTEEREALGSLWFEQEYMCKFVDNGSGWFARDVVTGALSDHEALDLRGV